MQRRNSAHASRTQDDFACHPAGIVRCKIGDDRRDIPDLANPAEWRLVLVNGLEVRADRPGGMRAFGFDQTGTDGIDTDPARPEFPREHAGDRVNRAFRACVDRALGRMDTRDIRADVDNASPLFHVRHSGASDQERPQNVDFELSAIQFLGGLFDLVELVNAGVINDDIQAPEDIDGRVDQRFDFRLVRDIRAHGHGSSTSGSMSATTLSALLLLVA